MGRESACVHFLIIVVTFIFAFATTFCDKQNKFKFQREVAGYCQILRQCECVSTHAIHLEMIVNNEVCEQVFTLYSISL